MEKWGFSRGQVPLLLSVIALSFVLLPTTNSFQTSTGQSQPQRLPASSASLHMSDPLAGPSAKRAPLQKKKDLKQFSRFLEVECWKRAELRDLEPVLASVAEACRQINRIVQRAQTDDIYGVAVKIDGSPLDDTNVQGEVQQKLDVLCNTIMLRAFCGSSRSVHSVASEEEDEPRCCSDVMVRAKTIDMFLLLNIYILFRLSLMLSFAFQNDSAFAVGNFIAVFDPLDGSKNIDASLPVGSIFGIYKKIPGKSVDDQTFLQDGSGLVAAGYCLFSYVY